jgi:hypothetical protein
VCGVVSLARGAGAGGAAGACTEHCGGFSRICLCG